MNKSGKALGDLAGTFPAPEVAAVHETSGPTKLTIGTITDGEFLKRSGSTLVSAASAPPSGAAGGDLTGTYPNPTIDVLKVTTGKVADLAVTTGKIALLAVTDAQVAAANKDGIAGTVSMRTLGTSATSACAGNDSRLSDSRAPSGAASGDLGGTYPSPTVAAIHETLGPTKLTIGTVVDGEYLKRVGTTLVSGTPPGGGSTPGFPWAVSSDKSIDPYYSVLVSISIEITGGAVLTLGAGARLEIVKGTLTGTVGGDLTGTLPNPTIDLLKVTTGKIADLAVTTGKIADLAVTTAKINDLAVTTGKIALLAVTDAQVATANKDGAAGTASMRTLSTTATTACAGNDSRLSDARAPTGAAGGGLAGTYPNPTVASNALSPYLASINGFRLTPVTAQPVWVTDSSSYGTIYMTPFRGQTIALYNGTTWDLISSAEVSYALSGRTTDLPFDIFAYNSAGTLTLEVLNWTSATARATALVRQDGVWCKTGALTRRYVGTCRARSATTYSASRLGASVRFDLFNADNRVQNAFSLIPGTNTWNYTTAIWRQANADTANQVDVMVGLLEECFHAVLNVTSKNTNAGVNRYVTITYGSALGPAGAVNSTNTPSAGDTWVSHQASYGNLPGAVGVRAYQWQEYSEATGTTTWVGDNGALLLQSGMTGTWTC